MKSDHSKTKTELIRELQLLRKQYKDYNIVEHTRIKVALQKSEEKYRKLYKNTPVMLHSIDSQGRIFSVSEQWLKVLGYSEEEVLGVKSIEFLTAASRKYATEVDSDFFTKGFCIDAPYQFVKKNGEIVDVLLSAISEKDDSGKVIRSMAVLIDITERKKTEEKLRESENKYRTLFEQSADAILIIEGNKFVDCNSATVKMLGYTNKTELLETHPSQLSPQIQPDGRNSFEKANDMMSIAFNQGSHRFEWDHKRKNGKVFPVEVLLTAIPFGEGDFLHVVWRDITDRKQTEEEKAKLETQLRRSQKLETIGTLAGGIAHDFNNILTPILGYADMALESIPPENSLHEKIERILKGTYRAKELVEQILLFSKQMERERHPLNLHLIVKEALKLLRSSIPTTVQINHRIDTSCSRILADPSQMHQVIVNICTNAWQAMEVKGGALTVELKQLNVDKATTILYPHLREQEYIRLSVGDTGVGMDVKTVERIFEPFFTTKAVDKGTGLGLSVVHGIIRSHDGEIMVESEPGKGSTFHVYLPTIKVEIESDSKKDKVIEGGHESIILVDDDVEVARVVKIMLEKLGYKIVVFNNSVEALKTIRQNSGKYDLVISDLSMPEMTGLELAKKMQKDYSDLPIIIMTGFGDSITGEAQKQYDIKQILGKPVLKRKLASVIRKVLD